MSANEAVVQNYVEVKKTKSATELTVKQRFLRVTNFLFAALLLIELLPNHISKDPNTIYLVGLALGLEAIVIICSATIKKREKLNLVVDIIGFIYAFLIFWTLFTAKFNILQESLFPPPGTVFAQILSDAAQILINIGSSIGIVAQGFFIAIAIAIPAGLILGWNARLGNAAVYIAKFFGAIPPIVYIPYGIALLPTFRSVSVFVIFLATFWPVLAATMSGVMNVESKIINSAKTLNVNGFTMLFRIILPAALPQIFIGLNQGLSVSFILLTSAEMIGARNGMGYYIKQYSDFGDYTRTIAGIIIIGIVVIAITFLFNKIQNHLLRWKR